MPDLLAIYSQLCQSAGEQPQQNFLDTLEQLSKSVQSEGSHPVTSLLNEIAFFERKSSILGQSTQDVDKEEKERSDLILSHLNGLLEACGDAFHKYEDVLRQVDALRGINPIYTRLDQLLVSGLSAELSRILPMQLNKELCGMPLRSLKAVTFTSLDFIFQDDMFMKLSEKDDQLKDFTSRVRLFQQVNDSIVGIRKCVPSTGLSGLEFKKDSFTCSRSAFDQQLKEISDSMAADELKTARFITQMIEGFTLQNAAVVVPTLNTLKGAIKRPRVKRELTHMEDRFQTILDKIFADVDDGLLEVSRFCQQIQMQNAEQIMSQIMSLRQQKQTVQQTYSAAQLFLGEERFRAIQATVKTLVEKLKQKEAEVMRLVKDLLQQWYKAVQQQPVQIMQFNQQGRLVVMDPPELQDLISIVTRLGPLGYDPKSLALQPEVVSLVETRLCTMPYIGQLKYVAQFYNSLTTVVKSYQKPLLLKSAAQYEGELRKCCGASDIRIAGSSGNKDAVFVGKIKKIAEYGEQITRQFAQKIELLDEFHSQQSRNLAELQRVHLSKRQDWVQKVDEMREQFQKFEQILPQDQRAPLYLYWSAGLCGLLATKFVSLLKQNLGQLPGLKQPISVSGPGVLSPSIIDVQSILVGQIAQIARLPADPELQLSDMPCVSNLHAQMLGLAVRYLPSAFGSMGHVVENLYRLQEYLEKSCGLVNLAQSQDCSEAARRLQTLENCLYLRQIASSIKDNINVEQQLAAELPFLQEKADEKHVYVIQPSGGAVTIDLQSAVRLFSQKKAAAFQVAGMAAGQLGREFAEAFLKKIDGFRQELDNKLKNAQDAAQFKALAEHLQKLEKQMKAELQSAVEESAKYLEVCKDISGQEEAVSMLEECAAKYQTLLEQLQNVSGAIEERRRQLYEQMQAQLLEIVSNGSAGAAKLQACAEQLMEYLEAVVRVKPIPGDENSNGFYRGAFDSKSALGEILSKSAKETAEMQRIEQTTNKIAEEVFAMFGHSHLELLNPSQRQVLQEVIGKVKLYSIVFQIARSIDPLEQTVRKYMRFEWAAFRSAQSIIDELQKLLEASRDSCKAADSVEIPQEDQQTLLKTVGLLRRYIMFIQKNITLSVQFCKMLKSSALQKQYWQEIVELLRLQQIQQYLTGQGIAQVPDGIVGASIIFSEAQVALDQVQYISQDQPPTAYKKLATQLREIIARAEGEQAVRNAVEEVMGWLSGDAKVTMGMHPLSAISVGEVQAVENLKALPLIGQWKALLTALTEKKAVLASVSTSQYAKPLKPEIDDAGHQIEALTRLAYALSVIGRQVAVLEPVMGRKVLPDQHQKFYSALRLLSFILSKNLGDAAVLTQSAQQSQGTVQLFVAKTIQLKIPDNLQVAPGSKYQRGVDNTQLGKYAPVIVTLETASSLLADTQVALREYLEVKRLSFPRFYFLADSDVLEILANANAKPAEVLAPHVKKLFGAIEALQIADFTISSFKSSEGEVVSLRSAIHIAPSTPPELWLSRLDLSIKETLKSECAEALGLGFRPGEDVEQKQLGSSFEINGTYTSVKQRVNPYTLSSEMCGASDFEALKGKVDIEKVSGEAACVGYAVLFASAVDAALLSQETSPEAENAQLQRLLQKQEENLADFTRQLFVPEISTASFGTQEYVKQLKLKAVSTDLTHYIQLLREMLAAPTPGERRWLWNRELKCRMHKASKDVYWISLDTFLPYTYEYQGLPPRLIHTNLTTRCYSTLTSALGTGKSSNPQGPAGTGKTESVKAYAAKLGRNVIVFNCDAAIDRQDLGRILAGIVLSGACGCFDEVNRLSPAVLSAISTDIENIQRAIAWRQTTAVEELRDAKTYPPLVLAGIEIKIQNVSPFAAVFVTMNPASREYRGRSELPFSLIKMLRGCFMGRADISQIMETVLSTSGFQGAPVWACKAELCYRLAARRVPKEVHLDWGLRSLQAVLRQAALARAGIARGMKGAASKEEILKMERGVVIKALSDATFSRVQSRSADIFREILRDVFGPIQAQSEARFGAASAVEAKFAEHIDTQSARMGTLVLQAYRALTAKLGVALLGKTASGKTTVRNLLKKAVEKASGGKIEVREFVIAPKSVSRSDLLGYVDQQTKEWNDGALTAAARAAVQALNQQSPAVWPWIVFDGSVDPAWIEALNSSLDDNRLLSLSSGERIRFPMSSDPMEAIFSGVRTIPTPINFIFETDSLEHASPATVSRLAVILVSDPTVEEQVVMLEATGQAQIAKIIPALTAEMRGKLADVTTRLSLAASGDPQDPIGGTLRALASESGKVSDSELQAAARALSGQDYSLSGSGVTPAHVDQQGTPTQQVWGIKLIQQYLCAEAPVLVAGPTQSSKYYCIQQAALYKDQFQLVTVSCTKLTTRADIINIITSQCAEYQRVDGGKELRPRSGKKLLICLRNIDVGDVDEYGHSEIYTLMWSIVGHRRLYLKQGQSVDLCGIILACTVESEARVPARLRRLMGLVRLSTLSSKDSDQILGDFGRMCSAAMEPPTFQAWLGKAVERHESLRLKARGSGLRSLAYLPSYLSLLKQLNYGVLISLSRMKPNKEMLDLLLESISERRVPEDQGKAVLMRDLRQGNAGKAPHDFLTFQKAGITAQAILKALQQDDPLGIKIGKPEVVSQKARLNVLQELLKVAQESYPGLRILGRVLTKATPEIQRDMLAYLQAMEVGLVYQTGLFIAAQPGLFAPELALSAALITGATPVCLGCDKFGQKFLKIIGEKVVAGHDKIAVFFDTATLQFDIQWVAFCAAVAAGDIEFLRSRMALADLRGLVGQYADRAQADKQDKNEEQQTVAFLKEFIAALRPVLIVNPERSIADDLLAMAPPIRRSFALIGFGLIEGMPPALQVIAQAVQSDFKSEDRVIERMDGEIKRFANVPGSGEPAKAVNQYIRQLILFNQFKEKWTAEIQARQSRIKGGLAQLNAAQKEVDALAKQAGQNEAQVKAAEEDANKALEMIKKKMETVEANKSRATVLEKELKAKEGDIFAEKEAAEKDLAQVKPLIEEAKQAVSNIPNDAIAEVKSFASPPDGVRIVLEAVVRFMGMQDPSWKAIRSFMGQAGVVRQIVAFDVNQVPAAVMKRVEQHIAENPQAFDQVYISRVSKAAAPLAKWVKANVSYLGIYTRIEPLIKKCEEANKNLVELKQNLANINAEVQQLEKDADELKRNYNRKTQEVYRFQAELEIIDKKKQAGQKMLDQLSGEKVRWAANEKEATLLLQQCDETALHTAAMFVLAGAKTDDVRDEFTGEFRKTAQQMMLTPAFQDDCQRMGLRVSPQALENAMLLEQVVSKPGFTAAVLSNVTEATGVLQYLRAKYQPQIVSAQAENVQNLISIAARFGQVLVVTDCDAGELPAAIVPYLRSGSEAYRVLDSSALGGEDQSFETGLLTCEAPLQVPYQSGEACEMKPGFKLIVIASVQCHVPAHLQQRLLELSFAPTRKSRADLYADKILEAWAPEALEKIQALQQTQTNLRHQLSDIEDTLLKALEESQKSKNILEDVNLTRVLEQTTAQNAQIAASASETQRALQELALLREKAGRIADVVGKAVSAFESLAQLNDLYIVDDSGFIPLLNTVLSALKSLQTPQEKITEEMVKQATQRFLKSAYLRLHASVFAADKAGAAALLLRYCRPDLFTSDIFRFFTGQKLQGQAQAPPAIPEDCAGAFAQALEALGKEVVGQLQLQNTGAWSGFAQRLRQAKDYSPALLPEPCKVLNAVQRAVLVTAARPDLASQLLQSACDEVFGVDLTVQPIQQGLELAQPFTQPIIIYTAAGQDPTNTLNAEIVALAPGKEAEADAQISKLVEQKTRLIVVKGAHLCQQWLQGMPGKLQEMATSHAGQNTKFVLLLEPKAGFPQGLSRIGWRVCLQQSSSPRQTMLNALECIRVPRGSQGALIPAYMAAMYITCALHTCLEARRAYQPRGVASDPGWSGQDPAAVSDLLGRMLRYSGLTDIGLLLERAFGYCQDVVYGVQTKDGCDLSLVQELLQLAFHGEVRQGLVRSIGKKVSKVENASQNASLLQASPAFMQQCDAFPGVYLFFPPLDALSQAAASPEDAMRRFKEFVQNVFPDAPSSDALCLPANALLTRGERASLALKSVLLRVSPTKDEGGVSAELFNAALTLAKQFEDNVKPRCDAALQWTAASGTKAKALIEELQQQRKDLLKIVQKIDADFALIRAAAENFLTAPTRAKRIAALLSAEICPEDWANGFQAPPCSMAPIDNPELVDLRPDPPIAYLKLLPDAIESLQKAVENCINTEAKPGAIVIELNLAPRPPAVLEAVRRYEGICQQKELDQVCLRASVGGTPVAGRASVVLKAGTIILEGAGYGLSLDFQQQSTKLSEIAIEIEATGKPDGKVVEVPFYLEKQREVRMPVTEWIQLETQQPGAAQAVSILAAYAYLSGR